MLDERTRSEQFPSLSKMTYLNTAAEGIPPRVVHDAMERYWADKLKGMAGRDGHFAALEFAKAQTAKIFGLTPAEVAICSCSSEAYNLLATALQLKDGDEVVINDLDFPAGATPWLTENNPASVKVWRARNGELHVEDLTPLLSARTRLVQTSLVSFLNGFMVRLPEVSHTVGKHSGALLSVDVTQALGRIPLDLRDVDVIISSTHKWILATHGGGLVGVRRDSESKLPGHAGGWFNLEDAFGPRRFEEARAKPGASSFAVGMPNFPAIYPIGAALEFIQSIGVDKIDRHARPLLLHCLEEVSKLPVELMTPRDSEHLAGIFAFKHPQMDRVNAALLEQNIHVMCQAGRLRVSIHGYTTAADVERFGRVLTEVLHRV